MATDSLQSSCIMVINILAHWYIVTASPETNFVCSKESTKISYQRRIIFALHPLGSQSYPKIIIDHHIHTYTLFTSLLIDFFFIKIEEEYDNLFIERPLFYCYFNLSVQCFFISIFTN